MSYVVGEGDEAAEVAAIYPSLIRRAAQLLGRRARREELEDLVQDGFTAWYRRRPPLDGVAVRRAYIAKTMQNLTINRALRRRDLLDLAISLEELPWLV